MGYIKRLCEKDSFHNIAWIMILMVIFLSTKEWICGDIIKEQFDKVYDTNIEIEQYKEIKKLKEEAKDKNLYLREKYHSYDFYYDMKKNEVIAILDFESREGKYEGSCIYEFKLNNILYPLRKIKATRMLYSFVDLSENIEAKKYHLVVEDKIKERMNNAWIVLPLLLAGIMIEIMRKEKQKEKNFKKWIKNKHKGKWSNLLILLLQIFIFYNVWFWSTGMVFTKENISSFYKNASYWGAPIGTLIGTYIRFMLDWEEYEKKYMEMEM